MEGSQQRVPPCDNPMPSWTPATASTGPGCSSIDPHPDSTPSTSTSTIISTRPRPRPPPTLQAREDPNSLSGTAAMPAPWQQADQPPAAAATATHASPFAGASRSGFEPSGPQAIISPFAHAPSPVAGQPSPIAHAPSTVAAQPSQSMALPSATSSAAAALLFAPSLITAPTASLIRVPTLPKPRPQAAPRDAAAAIAAAAIRSATSGTPGALAKTHSSAVQMAKAPAAASNKARRAPLFVGAGMPQGYTSYRGSDGGGGIRERREQSPSRSMHSDRVRSSRPQHNLVVQATGRSDYHSRIVPADQPISSPYPPGFGPDDSPPPVQQVQPASGPVSDDMHIPADAASAGREGEVARSAPHKRAPLFVGESLAPGAWGSGDSGDLSADLGACMLGTAGNSGVQEQLGSQQSCQLEGAGGSATRSSPSHHLHAPLPLFPFPIPVAAPALASTSGAASRAAPVAGEAVAIKKPLKDMYLGCSWASASLDDMLPVHRSPSPGTHLQTVPSVEEHPAETVAGREEQRGPAVNPGQPQVNPGQPAVNSATAWRSLPPTARTQTRLATSEHSRQLKDSARMSTQQGRSAGRGLHQPFRNRDDGSGFRQSKDSLPGSSASSGHGDTLHEPRSTGSSGSSWRSSSAFSPMSVDAAPACASVEHSHQGGARSRESSGGGSTHGEVWVRLSQPAALGSAQGASGAGKGQGSGSAQPAAPHWSSKDGSQDKGVHPSGWDSGRWTHGRPAGSQGGGRVQGEQRGGGGRGVGGRTAFLRSGPAVQGWREMLSVIEQDVGAMDAPSVAGALHRLGAASSGSSSGGRPMSDSEIQELIMSPVFASLKGAAGRLLPHFSARNVANASWGLAKLGHHPGPLLVGLARQARMRVNEATTQHVANTLWALATLGHHPGEPTMAALLSRALELRSELLPQHCSNLLLACAKLEHKPSNQVLEVLADEVAGKLGECAGQAVANSVWACARLDFKHAHLLHSVAAVLEDPAQLQRLGLNAQNCGNLLWSYAALGEAPGDQVIETMCGQMLQLLSTAAPQNLTNMLWALAKLSYHPPDGYEQEGQQSHGQQHTRPSASRAFVAAAIRHATTAIGGWQSQAVSNMTWALAALGINPGGEYLAAAAARMRGPSLRSWPPQHIANTLWALATLGYEDHALLDQVAAHLAHRLDQAGDGRIAGHGGGSGGGEDEGGRGHHDRQGGACASSEGFKPQHISNILWAYGTLERRCPRVCELLSSSMRARISEFSAQELSNSVWALARLAHYDPALMDAVGQHVVAGRVSQLLPQHLSNIAWAFARLTHQHGPLMSALATGAVTRIKELTPQHISNMVCAYAMLGDAPPAFVEATLQEAAVRCEAAAAAAATAASRGQDPAAAAARVGFNAQQVTNLLWGSSLLGACSHSLWRALMKQLDVLGTTARQLPEEALTQVAQAYLLLDLEAEGTDDPDAVRAALRADALPGLVEEAGCCWAANAARPCVSAMHREVSAALGGTLGVRHTNECLTADGMFSVDIAIELPDLLPALGSGVPTVPAAPGWMVALEVDGPSHFTANTGRPLGVTLARRRCLAARQWAVASVQHTDWGNARSPAARATYLRKLLGEGVARVGKPWGHEQ